MDKKKTGNLIKTARIKKNLTQNELGDLIGVSNKAISRWENGDSFPDVGVLESLSAVLDIRIQDIVTGEQGVDAENAVVDVVRVATLQQKEKKRRLTKKYALIVAILLGMLSGTSSSLLIENSPFCYVVLMLLSLMFTTIGCTSQETSGCQEKSRFYSISGVLALVSGLWIILLTWCTFLVVINGHTPFGMELYHVGPFVNWQLIGVYLGNILLLAVSVYRVLKYDEAIHWSWTVSLAVMYLAVMYSDLLYELDTVQGAMKSLEIRTIVVLATTGLYMVGMRLYQKNMCTHR